MAKNKILEATNKVVAVLQGFDSEDRRRVIDAALLVLRDASHDFRDSNNGGGESNDGGTRTIDRPSTRGPSGKVTPKSYVDSKDPDGKVEEIAVAARYRELYENADVSTKEEIAEVLGQKGARRNFNAVKFRRDTDNGRQTGLFTKGSARGTVVLSHYGQEYVDLLPDREKVKALRKPTGARRRTTARKAGKRG